MKKIYYLLLAMTVLIVCASCNNEWAGKVYIINPISTQYNNDDVTAFKKLAGTGVSNIKVIGIDEGATFVNNYISQNCYFIADTKIGRHV